MDQHGQSLEGVKSEPLWSDPDQEVPKKRVREGWKKRLPRYILFAVLAAIVWSILLTFLYASHGPFSTWNMRMAAWAGQEVQQEAAPLSEISPHLIRAVIAAEDARFCSHNGFDVEAIRQAVEEKEERGYLRGASTISQQTAKNSFLWNGGGWFRKGMETWFTWWTELFWDKRRIMEVYLNVAEWGDGIYGVEAAAQNRFGVPANQLTPWEAALLASVLPSPNSWRVDPPGPYVLSRARQIRARMNTVSGERLDACVWEN